MAVGENKTCTLTNNDIAATVKVIKHVINDNGGTNVAADWSIHLQNSTPAEVSGSPAAGSETGTTYTVPAGTYTASETGAPSGYHFDGFSGDCNSSGVVTVAVGENKTCTLTNNDIAPTVKVIKHVINDNGGTNVAADWSIHLQNSTPAEVSGSPAAGSETGTTYTVPAGTYTASETGAPSGYHFDGFSGDCNSSGVVTVAVGENKTCTLTNNDIAPTVKVIKHVINDNGGTALASAWSIHLKSGANEVTGSPQAGSETGTTYTVNAGSFTASETGGPSGYHFDGFSGDCNSSGVVTVAVGQNKTCTLTNNDHPRNDHRPEDRQGDHHIDDVLLPDDRDGLHRLLVGWRPVRTPRRRSMPARTR